MKMTIFVLLMSPIFSWAQIMPEPVTEALNAEKALVVCTFVDTDLDFKSVSVSADGVMVAEINPKYVSEEIVPFLAYKGLVITESKNSVRVQGNIVTMAGPVDLDLTVKRGKANSTEFLGAQLICAVK